MRKAPLADDNHVPYEAAWPMSAFAGATGRDQCPDFKRLGWRAFQPYTMNHCCGGVRPWAHRIQILQTISPVQISGKTLWQAATNKENLKLIFVSMTLRQTRELRTSTAQITRTKPWTMFSAKSSNTSD